ncbi:MAG: methylase [Proteobacteria bacterium]|nr:methylase [Pseudomonadota bacterium]
MKPFSAACERNKDPILKKLKEVLVSVQTVLEIGSGTGQHAVHFASALPFISWQTSDLAINHDGINAWISEVSLNNLQKPIFLDVNMTQWPVQSVDAVFTANTLHIMSWHSVEKMFQKVSNLFLNEGVFCVYGPFKFGGQHLSERNNSFDQSIRDQYKGAGVRDFENVVSSAAKFQLHLTDNFEMPSNNRLLVFSKST